VSIKLINVKEIAGHELVFKEEIVLASMDKPILGVIF
jgi:hypothetical protein